MNSSQVLPAPQSSSLSSSLWERSKTSLRTIASNIDHHEVLVLASSLAYTTALALAPFLVIMLSAISLLGSNPQQSLIEQMTALLGSQAGEAVRMIADNAQKQAQFSGLAGILSFVVLLISASAMFSQLRFALNKVNNHDGAKDPGGAWSFIHEKVLSVGLLLGFVFLLVVSLFITAGIALAFTGSQGFVWHLVSILVNFAIFTSLFTIMFRFIPSDTFALKRCFISGLSTTVFFLLGKTAIGIYIGKSAVGSAYGAAGSLVVLLVWLYYTSVTLLISYEFTNTVLLSEDVNANTASENRKKP